MKTRKSFLKRFKITRSGKVLRRVCGRDHFKVKMKGKKKRKLRKLIPLSRWEAKKIKKLLKN